MTVENTQLLMNVRLYKIMSLVPMLMTMFPPPPDLWLPVTAL